MPKVRLRVVRVTQPKPPYRIPSVDDIRALSGSANLTAISTFAGAGGSSTGYRWAKFSVPWASEFMAAAADTYEANWPETTVDRRDIRDVPGAQILDTIGMARGDLDLLDGSPPCQPFSMAGRREKNWHKAVAHGDGTVNRGGSEDLVGEWVRLVDELRPRTAVMENVRGLATGKAKGYLIGVMDDVRGLGYNVAAKLLDGQWLGVPQRRVRVFVVAVRDDIGQPVFPDPFPYRYSIADACPQIVEADIRLWGTDRTTLNVDEPSPTVVATGAQQNRPRVWENSEGEPRRFKTTELKRLCGFPDDYVLTGSYSEKWARLGNSVPPPMTRAVATKLATLLGDPKTAKRPTVRRDASQT